MSNRPKGPWAVAVVPALAVVPAFAKEPRIVVPTVTTPSASSSVSVVIAPSASASVVPAKGLGLERGQDPARSSPPPTSSRGSTATTSPSIGMATRARASALLPEVRLRVFRTADAGLRLYQEADAPDAPRSALLDGTQTGIEARFSFRLDRLVFADEEVPLERLRLERLEAAQAEEVATRVIELVVHSAKADRLSRDSLFLDIEREAAAATALEALAALDACARWTREPVARRQGLSETELEAVKTAAGRPIGIAGPARLPFCATSRRTGGPAA